MAQILVNRARKFQRDENGGLILFSLMLFFLMILMGGVAIDVMRYETIRTELQNTLDRCTLMAASLDQKLEPEKVVRDCVGKAGLTGSLAGVEVVDNMNNRSVSATGVAPTNPFFMHLIGIDAFDAMGKSSAGQGINNVEISLVLDVSGSMAGQKIANLKQAAGEFVDTVTAGDTHDRVTISIVPYNAQVNLGPDLIKEYNVQKKNTPQGKGKGWGLVKKLQDVSNSNCLELPADMYKNPGLSKKAAMNQMAHADYMYNTNYTYGFVSPTDPTFALPNFTSTFCRTTSKNFVSLPSNDPATVKAEINNLEASGNTSILMGMKWGTTLLDPETKDVFKDLSNAGKLDPALTVRPFAYEDKDNMKVIVLMTDGEHVPHTLIADDYKTGDSSIYLASDGRNSVRKDYIKGPNKYWVPHLMSWQSKPYRPKNGEVEELDWTDVWARLKVAYVAWQFYSLPASTQGQNAVTVFYDTFDQIVHTNSTVAEMDARLQEICAAAKNKNVIVYGIAFEAPVNGQKQIRDCATSESHYFAAAGTNIRSAFKSIASDITKLRLTQ